MTSGFPGFRYRCIRVTNCRLFGLALRKGRWPGIPQCGFPVRLLKMYKDKVRGLGISYVVIAEQGYFAAGLKRRVVTEKMTFVEG